MRQKKTYHANGMLRLAAILLCLVAASLYLVTGLYARYTTSATSSDGARVAKFEVTMGFLDESKAEGAPGRIHSNPFTVSMKPGDEETRTVTVKNTSEVAVKCTLTAENTMGNLPLVLQWESGEAGNEKAEYSANHSANEALYKTYMLHIRWPVNNDNPVNADVNYSKEVDQIVVTILCEQMD